MIFNSPEFLFAFLPILGLVLYLLYRFRLNSWLLPALLVASISFYLCSSFLFLVILAISILANYFIGRKISSSVASKSHWLIAGIVINVGYIALFKYTDVVLLFDANSPLSLPLGISFYSFIQLGYLLDVYEGSKVEKKLLSYSVFASFFPSISSGPITQNDDVGKQLNNLNFSKFNIDKITRGFCLVLIGLSKKVILADYASSISNSVYIAIEQGVPINSLEAWVGAIAYSLQLYFDFSGYSDIAVGLALMIGINLPWNFNSPYKAVNIVDFWRRWHMSLSNWLNNYVFEPINYSFNKKFKSSAFFGKNIGLWGYIIGTFSTMFLCGLWHGATVNYILWGLLHFAFIIINRFYNMFRARLVKSNVKTKPSTLNNMGNRLITFISVTVAWVLFRSVDLDGTLKMWHAMVGGNGIYLPEIIGSKLGIAMNSKDALVTFTPELNYIFTISIKEIFITLILLLLFIFYMPNSRQVMTNNFKLMNIPYLQSVTQFLKADKGWQPSYFWMFVMSILTISLVTWSKVLEFLYFKF